MKKNIVLLTLACIVAHVSFAQQQLKDPSSNIIQYKEYKNSVEYSFQAAVSLLHQATNGIYKNGEWKLINESTDKLNQTHYKFQLYYNDAIVLYHRYTVHVENGKVKSLSGDASGEALPVKSNGISEKEGLSAVLQVLNGRTYMWEDTASEQHLKLEQNDAHATYYPKGTKVYLLAENQLKIAWQFTVYAKEPLFKKTVIIDATNKNILATFEDLHDVSVAGTAVTKYSGTQTIEVDSLSPTNFILHDQTRGNGIRTWDLNTATSYNNAQDFTDTDNYWNNFNADQDEVATDAHWGAMMTYDYLLSVHNRNSIDGNGFALNSYIHYDYNYANAFWDGSRMTYGDGDASMSALTTVDIAGHEISHGLTEFTADLIYQNESGALNESFSDIFGTAIEFYAKPTTANWLLGDETGYTIRDMANPGAFGDPNCYLGNDWYTGSGDNGGVHINSGVQNFWFYLLTNGGSGTNDLGNAYSVTGIGINAAAEIAFRNLTVYLGQNSTYPDARFYAIQSAIDLFGTCSPEVIATANAWYACGVGTPYLPYVDADFAANYTEGCAAPFTVTFANQSSNGLTFTWDFGDGNTSTLANPTHTYTSMGAYDVTLIVDGGSCGADTTVFTDYIQVNDTFQCLTVMTPGGVSPTLTSCNGRILDSGAESNYPDYADDQITIAPVGSSSITLTFNAFSVEAGSGGSGCDYDELLIYAGSNAQAPLVGSYCNSNPPPSSLFVNSGQVFIHFTSDYTVNESGFDISYQCALSQVPPVAQFTANETETCMGTIHFQDLSTNGPTTWAWDFGDGNTSADQNPTHEYLTSGTYEVELIVTNANGSDTEVKSNYIMVNRLENLGTFNSTTCLNRPDTLISSNIGTTYWFDSLNQAPIFVGDTFITPVLTAPKTYYMYAENVTINQLGPVDNTIGTGGIFNGSQTLSFVALNSFKLRSVKVYAETEGMRTIEVRNPANVLIASKSVQIPAGESRVQLDFEIPQGSGYKIGIAANSMVGLYRNNTGASYPYNVPNVVTITTSSGGSSYYYFFYDWEVSPVGCYTNVDTISLVPEVCTSVEDISQTYWKVYPNPATNQITLEFDALNEATVQILDVTGKMVYSNTISNPQVFTIKTNKWARGVYTVQVINSNSVSRTQKLVIQ